MELWQELKVGDRIRLVEMPPEFAQPNYLLHPETRLVYRKLLARRRPLRVCEIDENGYPWIHCRLWRRNRREYHWLMVNHGGIVRVRPRRAKNA